MQSNYSSLIWQGQDQQHKDKEEQRVEAEEEVGLVWGANKQLMKYTNNTNNTSVKHELLMDAESLTSSFKPMLEHDSNTSSNWYANFINSNNTNDPSQFFQPNSQICHENHALLPPIESASSSYLSSLLSASGSNYPFESSVDFICDVPGFVEPFTEHPVSNLRTCGGFSSRQRFGSDLGEFPVTHLVENGSGSGLNLMGAEGGFDTYGNISPLFVNRAKILRPNLSDTEKGKKAVEEGEGLAKTGKEKKSDDCDMDGVDGLGFTSDSDELKMEENASTGGSISNLVFSSIQKGKKEKKKGQPAKNLMAERRRRKKLNDRLYMLRSVVPKISKMDRASILVDAIEYLKELLQRIKDLNDELQSITPNSSLPSATSFSPFNTAATMPSHHVKEEASGSSLPNVSNQPPRVHVEVGEGSAFSIHMFCARRPGLLLSTIQALENLGIDIQQAVVSCFNGFAMDVFKAEKCDGGLEVQHDQIKAALLEIAAYHGLM